MEERSYLHFVKHQLVPDAVVSDDALLHLRLFHPDGQVQQPFLGGSLSAALDL